MAISAEAQTALDALAALKDEAVDRMLAFNSRYESIASDLSQEDAEASLIDLDFEFHEWNDDYITRLEKAQEEVQFEIDAGDITDVNEVSDARAELMDVVDNQTELANELSDNLASARIEAARLSEEQNSAENTDPADTDNTKAPAGNGEDDEKGSNSKGPTSTTPGKAGKSKADDSPKVGLRDYNPLSEFSSYTYRISLYMMNSIQLNAYMKGDRTVIKDFQLIVQSGGVTSGLDSPRAAGLDLDLYIDDLEIVTKTSSKETMTATNSVEFRFKIYEPYGFTFPHKLTKAMAASQKRNAEASNKTLEQIRSLNESFLLVIKFYGYDKDGKLVSSTDYPQPNVTASDSQSVFERGFPIRFKDFKFKLENKITVYSISAVQYAEQVAKGTNSGSVPAKISVSGETVKDVLLGKSQESSKKSIIGLAEMLNNIEKDEIKKGKKASITYPNVYKIEFATNTGIDDSLLVPKDYYVKERSPMATIEGGSASSNERTSWQERLGTVEKKVRAIEVPAGLSIVQAIDNIISQSEYLKKMMVAVDKEINETVKPTDSSVDINSRPATLSWYNINTVVTRTADGWDEKRGDYAHAITYVISKYEIPYIRSLYTSSTMTYYGPHKRYNYWYTGKNTEILSYEQNYNFLYTLEGSLASDAETRNLQSAKTKMMAGIAGTDPTTAKSGKNDIVNSVKSFLYSPGDLINFKLKVLGDPDYLMPSVGMSDNNSTNQWYGKDLSINPNSGQVFFEIIFQQVEDYDNMSGLLVPNSDIQFAAYPDSMKVKPKGIVYMLTEVTSQFSKGKFEQTLKGVIPEFVNAGAKDGRDSTPPAATSNNRQTKQSTDNKDKDFGSFDPGSGGDSWDNSNPTSNKSKVSPAKVNPKTKVADDDGSDKPTSAQVLSKDAGARDPVTLLPKR